MGRLLHLAKTRGGSTKKPSHLSCWCSRMKVGWWWKTWDFLWTARSFLGIIECRLCLGTSARNQNRWGLLSSDQRPLYSQASSHCKHTLIYEFVPKCSGSKWLRTLFLHSVKLSFFLCKFPANFCHSWASRNRIISLSARSPLQSKFDPGDKCGVC